MTEKLERALETVPDRKARAVRALFDVRQTHLSRRWWT